MNSKPFMAVKTCELTKKDCAALFVYHYVSIDLFDTLIYRSALSYSEVLEATAEYASHLVLANNTCSLSAEQFLAARRESTSFLKRQPNQCGEEPELSLVFLNVFIQLGLNDELSKKLANQLLEFEFSVELHGLRALKGSFELLQALRQEGCTLIVTSDMYFSRKHIKTILDHLLIGEYIDFIIVSSEYGATKRSGKLFVLMLKELQIAPNQLIHAGDNIVGDYRVPRSMGIEALCIRGASLKSDACLVKAAVGNEYALLAQLVLAFLVKIVTHSATHGVGRLYFLSRDATIIGEAFTLFQLNSNLVSILCEPLEVKHLAINRKLVRMLNLSPESKSVESVLFEYLNSNNHRKFFLKDVFECLNMQLNPNVFDTQFLATSILSKQDCIEVASQIRRRSKGDAMCLVENAHNQRDQTLGYLNQEGVLDTRTVVGLVDLGYAGSIAKNIATYRLRLHEQEARDGGDSNQSHKQTHSYLLCSGNQPDTPKTPMLITCSLMQEWQVSALQRLNYSWLEIFFQSSYCGPLVEYNFSDGVYVPTFERFFGSNNQSEEWLRSFKELVEMDELFLLFFSNKYRTVALSSFSKIMANPSSQMLLSLSDTKFMVGADINERSVSIVDSNITLLQILSPNFLRRAIQGGTWIEGSLAASGLSWLTRPLSLFIAMYFKLGAIINWFKGIG